ncbi:MAG TPA: hypothetical protein VN699_13155, partial [Pirellulales bacterium]|nr:hypothetical protein [Pirellulales bacterium]
MSHQRTARWLFSALPLVIAAVLACPSLRAADEDDAKPSKAAAKDGKKSAKAANGAASGGVPDGSPRKLLEYIEKMQATAPKGDSRSDRMDDLRRIQGNIIAAAEKIDAAEPDDETAAVALRAELDALSLLKRLGDADSGEKLDALIAKLESDKRPSIAQMVEFHRLLKQLEDLELSSKEDVEAFIAQGKAFLSKAKLDQQIVPLAAQVVQLSQKTQE